MLVSMDAEELRATFARYLSERLVIRAVFSLVASRFEFDGPAEFDEIVRDGRFAGNGFVYAIADGEMFKLGHSKSPFDRVAALQTGNPRTLRLVAYCSGTLDDERAIHAGLSPSRACGEWFRPDPCVRRVVALMRDANAANDIFRITCNEACGQ